MTFEENLTRLNDIVGQLENDKLPLEKALELYKEGIDCLLYTSPSPRDRG